MKSKMAYKNKEAPSSCHMNVVSACLLDSAIWRAAKLIIDTNLQANKRWKHCVYSWCTPFAIHCCVVKDLTKEDPLCLVWCVMFDITKVVGKQGIQESCTEPVTLLGRFNISLSHSKPTWRCFPLIQMCQCPFESTHEQRMPYRLPFNQSSST